MKRNVKNQYIDLPKKNFVSANKTDYLFVWMHFDEISHKKVLMECELKKKCVPPEKAVFVEDTMFRTYDRVVDVVKKDSIII